jgi:uncharacterized protein YbaR (Trm112 family)
VSAIFNAKVDSLCCPECKGDINVIAFIEKPDVE